MVLQRLLELPIRVVGGRQRACDVDSEYLVVADIDIASEPAKYGDLPHPTSGLTGGDGLHDPLTGREQPRRAPRPHDRAGAARPPLYGTLQKQKLNPDLPTSVQDVPFGMALEGLAAADLAYQDQAPDVT
jgi:hypothetical protein